MIANTTKNDFQRQVLSFVLFFFIMCNVWNVKAQTTTQNINTSGTWVCPAGVTSIQVEAYGAGGGGGYGGAANKDGGGGGGAGAYTINTTVAVTPSVSYTITIGQGGAAGITATPDGGDGTNTTAIFDLTTVTSNSGKGGKSFANGFAGGAGGTAGTNKGGDGANGNGTYSGGGGGGAGTTGIGGNGVLDAAGAKGPGGTIAGAGGAGNTANAGVGIQGNNYGGGGGGGTKDSSGGIGANGYVVISYATPPPSNDNCTGAIALTVNTSCTYTLATTALATASAGVPAPSCGGYLGGDVWFSAVIPASGILTVDTKTGVIVDSGMAVYSGTCGSLSSIQCDDDSSADGSMSAITVTGRTPGEIIFIRVWEYSNDNNGTFSICASTPPACIAPASQASAFTIGTITTTAVPASFTGIANGYLVIRSLTNTPPTQPVNGTLYSAANIATLGSGLSFVQTGSSTSITGTGLVPATTYYYFIYAYNNTSCSAGPAYTTSGPLTGNGTTLSPPANNNCSGAVSVTVNSTLTCTTSTNGTTINATQSQTACGAGGADDDVWYSFTATSASHIITVTPTTLSDAVLEVFSGTCGGTLTNIACIDNTGGTNAETTTLSSLTSGTTYFVRVYSYSSTSNQGTFSICVTTQPACIAPVSQATAFVLGTITSNAVPATFTGSADNYLVIRSLTSTPPSQPVNGTVYSTANIATLGAGLTFVQTGVTTSITGTGLNGNTQYYYFNPLGVIICGKIN